MKEIIRRVSKDFAITTNEAELIVATLLEKPRFEMYLNKKIDTAASELLMMKLAQLRKGVPIEYITKKVQFLNHSLHIYPGVFIPRIETEYFIELIKNIAPEYPEKILEIGTGTGAIAIALATIFSKTKIIATDISQHAIECAAENIRMHNMQNHIELLCGNMFEALSIKFDLIVSNPPYIPTSRLNFLPKSVKTFEPLLAIDGGKEGVEFINKLIQQGHDYINQNGTMAIEIDEDSVSILQKTLETSQFKNYLFKKDLFNRFRYLFIELSDYKCNNFDYNDKK